MSSHKGKTGSGSAPVPLKSRETAPYIEDDMVLNAINLLPTERAVLAAAATSSPTQQPAPKETTVSPDLQPESLHWLSVHGPRVPKSFQVLDDTFSDISRENAKYVAAQQLLELLGGDREQKVPGPCDWRSPDGRYRLRRRVPNRPLLERAQMIMEVIRQRPVAPSDWDKFKQGPGYHQAWLFPRLACVGGEEPKQRPGCDRALLLPRPVTGRVEAETKAKGKAKEGKKEGEKESVKEEPEGKPQQEANEEAKKTREEAKEETMGQLTKQLKETSKEAKLNEQAIEEAKTGAAQAVEEEEKEAKEKRNKAAKQLKRQRQTERKKAEKAEQAAQVAKKKAMEQKEYETVAKQVDLAVQELMSLYSITDAFFSEYQPWDAMTTKFRDDIRRAITEDYGNIYRLHPDFPRDVAGIKEFLQYTKTTLSQMHNALKVCGIGAIIKEKSTAEGGSTSQTQPKDTEGKPGTGGSPSQTQPEDIEGKTTAEGGLTSHTRPGDIKGKQTGDC